MTSNEFDDGIPIQELRAAGRRLERDLERAKQGPGIHKRYLAPFWRGMGDAFPNAANCSTPECGLLRREVRTTCCDSRCPCHNPFQYRGRHRA